MREAATTLSQRINYSTWNFNLNPYSTRNSNLSLVFNLEFQFQWGWIWESVVWLIGGYHAGKDVTNILDFDHGVS